MPRFSYKKLEGLLNQNPFGIKIKYSWRHAMPIGLIEEKNNHVCYKFDGKEKCFDYLINRGTYSFESPFSFGILKHKDKETHEKYYWFEETVKKYIDSLNEE